MNKEQKKKIGLGIYYTALIIAVAVMLAALVIVKSDDADYISRIRHMIAFYSFSVLISGGAITREFLVEEFILKKMIIKIVMTAVTVIAGTICFIVIPKPSAALILFFLSLAVTLFDLAPTIPKENKQNK